MSVSHGEVADERHGIQCVEAGVIKHGIVATRRSLCLCGHLVHDRRCANTEIIILIPIGTRAGADVTESTFVGDSQKSLGKASSAIAPVGSQAAVTHGPQIFVVVGHRIDIADGEAGIGPTCFRTVGGVVDETDLVDVVVAGGLTGTCGQEDMWGDAI